MDDCKRITARQALDKKKGNTTSAKMVEFIRRTCPCEVCSKWRQEKTKPAPRISR